MAAQVSQALKSAGIRAVLTGGACATIHSDGKYQSEDLDFIIQSVASQRGLDDAMGSIGFRRRRDSYVHSGTDLFVEFPRGPLALGHDIDIRPVEIRIGRTTVAALSATDSCRDRLAAFFHWNDRQSLETAVAIAARNRVDLTKIKVWGAKEGSKEQVEEFVQELRAEKRARRKTPRKRSARHVER